MCIGCGGTCAPHDDDAPRFTRHAAGPDLRVVGTANGPTELPDSVVRRTDNGLITYEDLYTGLGPDGKPALLATRGTFGMHATRAGRT